MSKKTIRCIGIFITLSIMLTLFAGCGTSTGKDNPTNSNTSTSIVSTQASTDITKADPDSMKLEDYPDVMKLSPYYGVGTASPTDPNNNATVKYIRERCKIDLSGSIFPSGEDIVQKVSMMIASKNMPDVVNFGVSVQTKELVAKFADAGMILETSEYIDKFMPSMKQHYTDTILNSYKNSNDGKLYCIPSFTVNPDLKDFKYTVEANLVMAVRKDLMEQVKMNAPATPDEFYELLKAFKALPAVDGKSIIPYQPLMTGGEIQLHIGAMFGIWTHRGEMKDSEKRMTVMQEFPEYLNYLKYAAKLFREDLIDKEAYMTEWQKAFERVKEGRVGVYSNWPNNIIDNNIPLASKIPNAEFVPIKLPRVAGLDNTQFWPVSTFGWMVTVVNKNAKEPERIFKLMDWMTTQEGWATMCWGAPSKEEGAWYIENDKVIHNTEFIKKKSAEDSTYVSKTRGGWVYFLAGILQYLPQQVCDEAGDVNPIRTLAAELNKGDLYINPEQEAIDQLPMGPVKTEKLVVVDKLFKEKESKIIMTAKDDAQVETMYAEMMKDAEKAGLYEYLKEDYQAVQDYKAKK